MQVTFPSRSSVQCTPPGAARATQADDWVVVPCAHTLSDTLEKNGDPAADCGRVLQTLDRVHATRLMAEKVNALEDLFGQSRWSNGTFVQVARRLDRVMESRPSLPGSGAPNPSGEALKLLDRLTASPRTVYSTPQQLQELGYNPRVARQLIVQQPAVVRDLSLWQDVDPTAVRPRDLYRAMALPGGLQGYDAERVGNLNGEMYFAGSENGALSFGRERVRDLPATSGVMFHCQLPSFMIDTSPPKGGDAVYPILRAWNLPDPQHPDVRPYVAGLGTFQADSTSVSWQPD